MQLSAAQQVQLSSQEKPIFLVSQLPPFKPDIKIKIYYKLMKADSMKANPDSRDGQYGWMVSSEITIMEDNGKMLTSDNYLPNM